MNDRIVEISVKLFCDRGIKAVSMDDVAQALGISKRTLYENFSSKDELLVHCMEYMRALNEKEHKAIDSTSKDVLEVLTSHLFLVIKQLKTVSIAFLQDMTKLCKPTVNEKFREEKEQNRQYIAQMIKQGQVEGLIRTDINPELLIDIFTEQGPAIKELYAKGKYSMEEIFMNLFVIYLRGACTYKGVERIDKLIFDFKREN